MGPYQGIIVLDLTRMVAGPFCTSILETLGARIIKVEMPGRGDDSRQIEPFLNGVSVYFAAFNSGKESIALNLKAGADRAIFEKLIAKADVLVENFRPGVMDKLGYGYEVVKKMNPRLIFASVSGFGQTGPAKLSPAYDLTAQAWSGMMSLTGPEGEDIPTRVGTEIGDLAGGLFLTTAIGSALFDRSRTGKGAKIDIAMLDSLVALMQGALASYTATGILPEPTGSRHPDIAPCEAFRAKDGYLVIAIANDKLFHDLCTALGSPEWPNDPRFKTNPSRVKNRVELKTLIEGALLQKKRDEWLKLFASVKIPVAPVRKIDALIKDPQLLFRNMIDSFQEPGLEAVRIPGNPIKIEGYPDRSKRKREPKLDQHRAAILKELGING